MHPLLALFAFLALPLPALAGVENQLLSALRESGFRCSEVAAKDGFLCVDKARVHVLVPSGLDRHARNLFYAHGDTGACGPGASGENLLRDQMPALRRNRAVAVLPWRDPSRNYNYPLGALVNRIDRILRSENLPWDMAGHSWGGKLLPRLLLDHPAVLARVERVLLLDVGYDVDTLLLPPWKKVVLSQPSLQIRSISSTSFQKMERFTRAINAVSPGVATNKKVQADHCPTAAYFREL